MAIRMRRGLYSDFDPTKMLPGEWAVSIDSDTNAQMVWMCFAAGVVKRMGTYEDFKRQIAEATREIKEEYLAEFQVILDQIEELAQQTSENTNTVVTIRDDFLNSYLPQIQDCLSKSKNYASNASASASAAKVSEDNAKLSETAASVSENNARAYEIAAQKSMDSITRMQENISKMEQTVIDAKEQVAADKEEIDDTIKNSLLASSEEILASVKDYFDRAQQLYNSMYIDCDGETPQQRVVSIVSIDCGTPQSRLHDDNGILFDGGTPINRLLVS